VNFLFFLLPISIAGYFLIFIASPFMKRIALFIILFILVGLTSAQKTDSLKRLYSPSLPDTAGCNLLNKIGMSYFFNEGQLDSS
jgi:hypothetical protein